MAIELNPNNINIPSGRAGQRSRSAEDDILAARQQAPQRRSFAPANLNVIPSEASLATQIRSAVADKRAGNPPDRGSILNLLV